MGEVRADIPQRVDEIDWPSWRAVDPATLCFVVRDGQVLLIHKKRGLGGGKVNGPGGRLEAGETPQQCVIREVQEELCVTPTGLRVAGEISFQFLDGYSIHVHVYRADDCEGEPTATEEADPFWCAVDAIPYERMWEDDIHWLPLLLAERRFVGRFIFDGDRMVDFRVDETGI